MKFVSAALSLASILLVADAAPANVRRCFHRSSSAIASAPSTAISNIVVPSAKPTSVLSSSSVKPTSVASSISVKPTSVATSRAQPTSVPATPKPTSTPVALPSTSKPAVPASSSSSAPAIVPSTKPSSVLKKGLAYNAASATTPFGARAGWSYNWDSAPGGTVTQEFTPMLWGLSADHTNAWAANAQKAINAGATHLLGFNEPDLGAQSNLGVDAAVAGWKKYMQPFAGKAKLVSPAVTNGGPPMGLAYLDNFIGKCTGCTIDAVAIHIYDSATNIAYFQSYISGVAKRYGKPVWVTEFAGSGSADQQKTFMKTMVTWLEAQPFVERYAYFGDLEGVMISNNKLTDLGSTYLNA